MNDLAVSIEVLRRCQILDAAQLDQLAEAQERVGTGEELLTELLRRGVLTSYQAETVARGDARKLVLGQYVLLDLLGEGGMGQVFRARHQRMKRQVAVKVIRKDTTAGPQAVHRFNKEIEAAAQLSHPNVVLAHDAGEADDTLFFVMELVEGIDLGRLVQSFGPLPVGQACEFIRQAALGLQHAHERGLVHRDIKPSNLLLTYAGAVVKILDMGLARLQQGSEEPAGGLTRTGMVMGTPDFISPEQGRDSRTADIRSDVYSLGCTLYYLLAGQVPFPEGTFTEKLLKHNMDEPPPLARQRPDVPDGVAAVVARMMAKAPADRYQAPRDVAEALAPFAEAIASAECYRPSCAVASSGAATARTEDLPTPDKVRSFTALPGHDSRTARPSEAKPAADVTPLDSFTGPLEKPGTDWKTLVPSAPVRQPEPVSVPARRRRLVPLLLPALLGIGCAVAAFLFLVRTQNKDEGTSAKAEVPAVSLPTTVRPATGTDKKEVLASKKEELVAPKEPVLKKEPPPVKKEVEKPPEPPAKPFLGRLVEEFREEKNKQHLKVALTRDGRRAFAGWGDQLRFWDLDPAKPVLKPRLSTALANLHSALGQDPIQAVAIAPDSHRVLIGTTMDQMIPGKVTSPLPVLVLWDTASANEPRLLEGPKPADKKAPVKNITCVAFSPQGNRALAGSQDRAVRLWDLDGGNHRVIGEHQAPVSCVAFSPDGRYALSGGWDYQVILWDLVEKRKVHALAGPKGHQNIVSCVAFSPDGRYAVSAGHDRLLKLWDVRDGKWVRDFEGHTFTVRCAAFSPDGKRVLSGGDDEVIRLWTVDQVEPLAKLRDHRKSVAALAFSGDGKYAVSVGEDNTIRRWELPE